ncbi:MAG: hypothetical protein IKL48_01315 [Elusimicrobiaceae bacterium]|nr:hypothetical protein [Elusimicrobiaceae bacterium]
MITEIIFVLVVLVAGVFGFWTGKTFADKKSLQQRERENEQIQQILRANAHLSYDECMQRLCGKYQK